MRRLGGAAFGTILLLYAGATVFHVLIARRLGEGLVVHEGALSVLLFSALTFAFPLVGFLLTRKQPSNAIGWILLGTGLLWGLRAFWFDGYLRWTLLVQPGSLPWPEVVGSLTFPLWAPWIGLMGTFLILLFPDGRLPSSRWRPLAWASGTSIVLVYLLGVVRPGPVEQAPVDDLRNPFGIAALLPVTPELDAVVLLLPLCVLGCAAAVIVRFRRARDVERLQLKWLAAAGGLVAGGYAVLMATGAYEALTQQTGSTPAWLEIVMEVYFLSFVLIPLAIGIAVSRHGLYGIDRLVSRALSYALVTASLLGVYLAVVTAVSSLTARGDSVAVAASTLAVAALFQPLRRRVQARVDRRFNRTRYDAAQTVDQFRLRLRDEVDLDAVRDDLLAVVRSTVQPEAAGLWLRPEATRR
jgi:hypothetical protein